MSNTIMSQLQKYPKEAAIIGRLLIGYGEIEFDIAQALGEAIDNMDGALRAIYRMRSEQQRIDAADALMRRKYEQAGLSNEYSRTLGAIRQCRKIRNQFAHCHWVDDKELGLCFLDIQDTASKPPGNWKIKPKPIDLPLLKQQEAYFAYTAKCLTRMRQRLMAPSLNVDPDLHFAMPPKQPEPKLHNRQT
ncbi:MAG: hypothetical protein WEC00_07830 [Dongiaceae bacterium]